VWNVKKKLKMVTPFLNWASFVSFTGLLIDRYFPKNSTEQRKITLFSLSNLAMSRILTHNGNDCIGSCMKSWHQQPLLN
jgi:hypothetical protein